jgi:taurine dioxygenase
MLRDPRFERFEVYPFTGALGADVRGIDLAAGPDDAAFEDLRRVLHHHHVVAIRDQHLTPRTLHEVARRFGPFSGNPVHTPMDGFDDIIRFVREPDDTGKVIGEDWHMDLAWMAKPPGLTMLYGEVIPPVGGDTCFTSLIQTYRGLSDGMKSLLRGLTGVHSGRGVYAINAKSGRLGLQATNDAEPKAPTDFGPDGLPGTGHLFDAPSLQKLNRLFLPSRHMGSVRPYLCPIVNEVLDQRQKGP